MFKVDRIGTPFFHSPDTPGTSVSTTISSTPSNTATHNGHVTNAAPLTVSGRTSFFWNALLAPTAAHRFIVGQQFNLRKLAPDNVQVVELSGSIVLTLPEFYSVYPIFGKLTAAGAGAALDPVSMTDVPTILDEATQFVGTTLRTRAQTYRAQVTVHADDPTGTYFNGFCIAGRDASGGNIDRILIRNAFRTLEPDGLTRYYNPVM